MNFPDPNVTTEYEAPDGLKYVWNGFAWEIACTGGGGGVDSDLYLKKYGHIVDDAPGLSQYSWNEGVWLKGGDNSKAYIVLGPDAVINSPDRNISINADNAISITASKGNMDIHGNTTLRLHSTYDDASLGSTEGDLSLYSTEKDVNIQASNGVEKVDRVIDETSDPKQIVNKEYVDKEQGNFVKKTGDVISGELFWYPYKPAADGNPAENEYNGIKIRSRLGGNKTIFEATTGGGYVPEALLTYLEPTSPNGITNKKYVDAADEELRQDIIELEQEIDSIAPSVERGEWQYTDTGIPTNAGSYSMNTDTWDEGLGDPADIFAAVQNIVLNEKDKAGTIHSFDDVELGQLLEVFEETSADYGLYKILDVNRQSGGGTGNVPPYTYWSFDVALVRTGQGDKASGLARFKIFSPPSGGTADGFVLKSGDEMSGDLTIKVEQHSSATLRLQGTRANSADSCGTIGFKNLDQGDGRTGFLTYHSYNDTDYFRFNKNVALKTTPTDDNHVTTKGYVDAQIAGLTRKYVDAQIAALTERLTKLEQNGKDI